MALKLITFSGCPNAEKARKLLAEADLEFTEVNQDDLPQAHTHRSYSSPTLLDGEIIIFGSCTTSGAGACTLNLPSVAELKQKHAI